jgi:hypothetical protein
MKQAGTTYLWMDDEEPPMEAAIRLVDRGLRKNRSQRVALNAAYSAKHAHARHSVFCQSPFTPDRLHGSFLSGRLMRRSQLLCLWGGAFRR